MNVKTVYVAYDGRLDQLTKQVGHVNVYGETADDVTSAIHLAEAWMELSGFTTEHSYVEDSVAFPLVLSSQDGEDTLLGWKVVCEIANDDNLLD